MFKKNVKLTVDGVMGVFGKAIEQLEAVAILHDEEGALLEQEARSAADAAEAAKAEAGRARRVRDQLKGIVHA